ncbi:4,5-dihydroxyphthalate decarboxylase [Humibacter antri]
MSGGLRFGSMPYDQFRGLIDGRVTIDGAPVASTTSTLATEIFERMIEHHAFDVAELGLTYYLRTLDAEERPFVALPIFPARVFRQSSVFVNTASGIEHPADLAGARAGEFATYGHDAGVWVKGILRDEHGVDPGSMRWVIGGLDRPMTPLDYIPFRHPDGVDVRMAPPGADLSAMLEAGELDVLFSGNVPRPILERSPRVRRLWPDYRHVEEDYYRRTGIFPPAHVLVMRSELVEERPGIARQVYDACARSKAEALQRGTLGRVTNFATDMLPWANDLADRDTELLGDDPWAYGVARNRKAVDTFLRYHSEQGLSPRFAVDELFAPELLDT